MSDVPGPGWWKASDGKWYPPERQSAPPGWKKDPRDPQRLRYWDGTKWGQDTRLIDSLQQSGPTDLQATSSPVQSHPPSPTPPQSPTGTGPPGQPSLSGGSSEPPNTAEPLLASNQRAEPADQRIQGALTSEKVEPTRQSHADELKKLADLRDSGVLTEQEFAVEKARWLGTPSPPAPPLQPDVPRQPAASPPPRPAVRQPREAEAQAPAAPVAKETAKSVPKSTKKGWLSGWLPGILVLLVGAVIAGVIVALTGIGSTPLTAYASAVTALNNQQVQITFVITNKTNSMQDTSSCSATVTDPTDADAYGSIFQIGHNGYLYNVPAHSSITAYSTMTISNNDADNIVTSDVKVSC